MLSYRKVKTVLLLSLLPLLIVLPATCYSLLSLWCGWRFYHHTSDETIDKKQYQPAITIFKPVKGMDEGSYENFVSFCNQQYTGDLQIIFAVADKDDPAVKIIHKLQQAFPKTEILLNIDSKATGNNLKISNLINAFPLAKHDLLMICDSDIRVTHTFLSSVSSHFDNPDVGLVSSPYRTSYLHGTATALEALGFCCEMLPNVLVARQLEGLSFALGAAMTFRRSALNDIGGIESLKDFLADDYQLGNKIHLAGWKLALDRQAVESMIRQESFSNIFARQLRWARTMRVSRPSGYLASGITLPGLAMVILMPIMLMTRQVAAGLAALLLLYTVRLAVATIYSRNLLGDKLLPRWSWLLPFRDLMATVSWLAAFTGNQIRWRGQSFKVLRDGTLEKIAQKKQTADQKN